MPHILMIEDDTRLAGMVADYLAKAGYTVTRAEDAAAGIAALKAGAVDLVLLDLMLPDADGLDVFRRIRALPGVAADVPVVMVTAKGDPTDRVVGLEFGAEDYISKPFQPWLAIATRSGSDAWRSIAARAWCASTAMSGC